MTVNRAVRELTAEQQPAAPGAGQGQRVDGQAVRAAARSPAVPLGDHPFRKRRADPGGGPLGQSRLRARLHGPGLRRHHPQRIPDEGRAAAGRQLQHRGAAGAARDRRHAGHRSAPGLPGAAAPDPVGRAHRHHRHHVAPGPPLPVCRQLYPVGTPNPRLQIASRGRRSPPRHSHGLSRKTVQTFAPVPPGAARKAHLVPHAFPHRAVVPAPAAAPVGCLRVAAGKRIAECACGRKSGDPAQVAAPVPVRRLLRGAGPGLLPRRGPRRHPDRSPARPRSGPGSHRRPRPVRRGQHHAAAGARAGPAGGGAGHDLPALGRGAAGAPRRRRPAAALGRQPHHARAQQRGADGLPQEAGRAPRHRLPAGAHLQFRRLHRRPGGRHLVLHHPVHVCPRSQPGAVRSALAAQHRPRFLRRHAVHHRKRIARTPGARGSAAPGHAARLAVRHGPSRRHGRPDTGALPGAPHPRPAAVRSRADGPAAAAGPDRAGVQQSGALAGHRPRLPGAGHAARRLPPRRFSVPAAHGKPAAALGRAAAGCAVCRWAAAGGGRGHVAPAPPGPGAAHRARGTGQRRNHGRPGAGRLGRRRVGVADRRRWRPDAVGALVRAAGLPARPVPAQPRTMGRRHPSRRPPARGALGGGIFKAGRRPRRPVQGGAPHAPPGRPLDLDAGARRGGRAQRRRPAAARHGHVCRRHRARRPRGSAPVRGDRRHAGRHADCRKERQGAVRQSGLRAQLRRRWQPGRPQHGPTGAGRHAQQRPRARTVRPSRPAGPRDERPPRRRHHLPRHGAPGAAGPGRPGTGGGDAARHDPAPARRGSHARQLRALSPDRANGRRRHLDDGRRRSDHVRQSHHGRHAGRGSGPGDGPRHDRLHGRCGPPAAQAAPAAPPGRRGGAGRHQPAPRRRQHAVVPAVDHRDQFRRRPLRRHAGHAHRYYRAPRGGRRAARHRPAAGVDLQRGDQRPGDGGRPRRHPGEQRGGRPHAGPRHRPGSPRRMPGPVVRRARGRQRVRSREPSRAPGHRHRAAGARRGDGHHPARRRHALAVDQRRADSRRQRRGAAGGGEPDRYQRPQTRRGRTARVERAPRGTRGDPHPRTGTGAPPGRGSQPDQGPVPGSHEPRDPHPDERRDRHGLPGAQDRSRSAPARLPGKDPLCGRTPAGHHRRHPRHLQDRGGQAGNRAGRLCARPRNPDPDHAGGPQGRQPRAGTGVRTRSRLAARAARRSAAPGPGADQLHQQRHQVQRKGPHRRARAPGGGRRHRLPAALRGERLRHRPVRTGDRAPVPVVPAGRHLHHARAWRHRPGAGHLQAAGAADGRRSGRAQPARRGQHLLVHGPPGDFGRQRAAGDRTGAGRRCRTAGVHPHGRRHDGAEGRAHPAGGGQHLQPADRARDAGGRGVHRLPGRQRPGSAGPAAPDRLRLRADGRADAIDGRPGSDAPHPRRSAPGRPAGAGHDGHRHQRRPRPLHCRRHGRLHLQADPARPDVPDHRQLAARARAGSGPGPGPAPGTWTAPAAGRAPAPGRARRLHSHHRGRSGRDRPGDPGQAARLSPAKGAQVRVQIPDQRPGRPDGNGCRAQARRPGDRARTEPPPEVAGAHGGGAGHGRHPVRPGAAADRRRRRRQPGHGPRHAGPPVAVAGTDHGTDHEQHHVCRRKLTPHGKARVLVEEVTGFGRLDN
uniref:Uncharacterized protein n=1 Tax=Tanacetum cinerariifolium TaxID=118510 RepID=A0A699GH23_TANCI|nr:hypothetical protein [Tanacetum cinerariifolium]